jgi:hypothetical protein
MIKQAAALTVAKFNRLIDDRNLPTGAKTVGGGTVLVYMSGTENYYISDSPKLRAILWEYKIEP